MHIIIGIITAAAGLIWALYNLQNSGVDLNSFNPFYWARRRSWAKKVGAKPLHCIDSSMEAAAVLVVAVAELPGLMTQELKDKVIDVFCREFNLSAKDAASLYASSSYLLKEAGEISHEVQGILSPSLKTFEEKHVASLLGMLKEIASFGDEPSDTQKAVMEAAEKVLKSPTNSTRSW
ncbi:hypothetical protein [Aurantivibrio plasticivorans]